MRPRLQLVTNPLSGNHSAARIAALAVALEARGFAVRVTPSSPSHPLVLDPAAAHLCVAGGDGTVRHTVAALLQAGLVQAGLAPRLSVYPMGTINLVAREWNAPRDPDAFAAHVVECAGERWLHPVAYNQTCFVACASIGPDARAVAAVSDALKHRIGRLAYAVALVRVAFDWQRPQLTVECGGQVHHGEALYLAKGRYFAGPWRLVPGAALAAPKLHMLLLKRARRRDFGLFLVAAMLGRAHRLSNVIWIETEAALRVTSDRPHPVQLDGDADGTLPADIRLHMRLPSA
jgi:diacylglycerol kinase (ATP)